MFSGKPIDAGHADAELSQIAHLLVGDLTAEEIVTVRAASPSVDKLFDHAGDRLTALLANPFNLNLAGELVSAEVDVSRIRSRLDLLTRFWQLRVTDAPDGRVRQRVVQTLVGSMIVARSQQVRDSQLHESAMLAALDGLLHDGVLREGTAGRWAASRPIGFAHPVLFDYAAATVALDDHMVSDSLAESLDADPNLAMLLRPSLEPMSVHRSQPSTPRGVEDNIGYSADRQRPVRGMDPHEHGASLGRVWSTPPEPGGDRGAHIGRQRQLLNAVALTHNRELAPPPVDVVQSELGDLTGAQPEPGQQEQDRVISPTRRRVPIA
jgi:hypothetical protein